MMAEKPKWIKLAARNEHVLNWSSQIHTQQERLRLDKLYLSFDNYLIIRFNSPLTNACMYNGNFISTNFNSLIKEINPEIDDSLKIAEETIEKDLKLNPGKSKGEAKALYMRHKYNMGLMMRGYFFAEIINRTLKEHLKNKVEIGEGFLRPHKNTLLIREHFDLENIRK